MFRTFIIAGLGFVGGAIVTYLTVAIGVICAVLVPIWVARRRGPTGPQTAAEKSRDMCRTLRPRP